MTRAKNPRRMVMAVLREMGANVRSMAVEWDRPRVAVTEGRRAIVRAPDDQQPENCPEDWDRLVEFMETVVIQANGVANYARGQAAQLRDREV